MALYNGGYPVSYQPAYQPYQYQGQQAQQGGLIWVSGEAGAKAYLVAPNTTVQLWDSEAQTVYLKSADASGMPSMKILDYTIRESTKNGPVSPSMPLGEDLSSYATKEEIRAVSEQITALRDRVDNLTKRKHREEDDNG